MADENEVGVNIMGLSEGAHAIVSVPTSGDGKPGFKTTEFWLAILVIVGVFVLAGLGKLTIENAVALIPVGLVAVGYAHSRGVAKAAGALLLACLLMLPGCASPAEDYVRAEAAAWAQFDTDNRLDRWIDTDKDLDGLLKDALHQLNKGRRARVAHALAVYAPPPAAAPAASASK